MNIHLTAVRVDDIGTAIDWYCQKLNFDVEYQDNSWALLSFENSRVALVLPEQHPPHLAFETDNAYAFGELTTLRDGKSASTSTTNTVKPANWWRIRAPNELRDQVGSDTHVS